MLGIAMPAKGGLRNDRIKRCYALLLATDFIDLSPLDKRGLLYIIWKTPIGGGELKLEKVTAYKDF